MFHYLDFTKFRRINHVDGCDVAPCPNPKCGRLGLHRPLGGGKAVVHAQRVASNGYRPTDFCTFNAQGKLVDAVRPEGQ